VRYGSLQACAACLIAHDSSVTPLAAALAAGRERRTPQKVPARAAVIAWVESVLRSARPKAKQRRDGFLGIRHGSDARARKGRHQLADLGRALARVWLFLSCAAVSGRAARLLYNRFRSCPTADRPPSSWAAAGHVRPPKLLVCRLDWHVRVPDEPATSSARAAREVPSLQRHHCSTFRWLHRHLAADSSVA